MSRLTKRILLTALLGLFLTVPGIVRSQGFDAKTLMRAQQRGQTGSLYGNNPFEQPAEEGEEGEQRGTAAGHACGRKGNRARPEDTDRKPDQRAPGKAEPRDRRKRAQEIPRDAAARRD